MKGNAQNVWNFKEYFLALLITFYFFKTIDTSATQPMNWFRSFYWLKNFMYAITEVWRQQRIQNKNENKF